jgi:ParB/RepB/Spo0J family partition protein
MNETVAMLKVSDIIPTEDNPRIINVNSSKFIELLESVKQVGVQIPICVRPHPTKKGKYDLRYGEKRLKAAELAKSKTIRAIIYEDLTDEEAFDLTFVENFGRDDLTPLEDAKAVDILLAKHNGDVAAVAAKLGHNEKWVRLRARVNNELIERWKDAFEEPEHPVSKWSIGHLCLIARLPSEMQDKLLDDFNKSMGVAAMTIAKLEDKIEESLRVVNKSPWKKDDAELLPDAGACSECNKRSRCEPGLWEDMGEPAQDDKCLDPRCWEKKKQAYLKARVDELKQKHTDLVLIETSGGYEAHRDAEELLKAKVLNSYSYDNCKKSDEGAKPAVIVSGTGIGTVKWIKTSPSSSSSSSGKKTAGKKTFKEKQNELNSKRWHSVLTQIIEYINEADFQQLTFIPDTALLMQVLIAEFGTSDRHNDKPWSSTLAYLKKIKSSSDKELLEDLWFKVAPQMAADLQWNFPISQVNEKFVAKAKDAEILLGLNHDDLWEKACDEYKEPASWKKEVRSEKSEVKKKVKPEKSAKKTAVEAEELPPPCESCKAAHPGCDDCCKDCDIQCDNAQDCKLNIGKKAPKKPSKKKKSDPVHCCRECGRTDDDGSDDASDWPEPDLCGGCQEDVNNEED